MTKTRVVHVRDKVPGAVYIGRAMPRQGLKGEWGNPYKIGEYGRDRAEVIRLYRDGLVSNLRSASGPMVKDRLLALAGKPLACWCRHDGEAATPDNACHGDVLVELIDALTENAE